MTSAPPPAPPVEPPGYEPPPPPPGPPARTQLRRSSTDKMVGGVAGGLAEYSGVDPLLWRVGFVALTFAGGSGILVYLLLWLLMPAGPPAPYGSGGPGRGAVERRPPGPRSPVPRVTIAGLLIVAGVLVLITRYTAWDIGPRGVLGAALLVVGAGLIVAAFADGRTARGGLIALGTVLSLALITASADWHDAHDGRIGDQRYVEYDADMVQRVYDCGLGNCTVDLANVDVSDLDRPVATRVDAGIGEVQVLLPRSADVRVHVDPGIGSVRVFGADDVHGGDFSGLGSASWTGDDEPEFELTINAGVGDVEVAYGA